MPLSRAKLEAMDEVSIVAYVFRGASPSEPRSLRERIGDTALAALPEHPDWDRFSGRFRDWAYLEIQGLLDEDLAEERGLV